MNPLVKKEIRLLLPSWIVAVLLVVLLPWFWTDPDASFVWTPFLVFFGMIMLAVDSFGRECSLGTFQLLLSQPIERRRIWRTKITVLIFAAALIFAGYCASCELLFHQALKMPVWRLSIESDLHNAMLGGGVVMLVALAGGLWTTLLVRQVSIAFWTAFLAPAGLLMAIILFLPSKLSDHAEILLLYCVAGLYIVWGFWLAHRLFYRAQDAAWTGGIVSFSTWRYFEAGSESSVSTRHRKPFAALAKKECQLQSISLICAGALLALHIAVILMRKVHGHFEPKSMAGTVSEFYWSLWLVMPLIIGCTAVAEEHRLGVMEGQSCLPASRRLQFALKFFPAIIAGLFFGALMPLLMERIAASIGAPNPDFHFDNPAQGSVSAIIVASFALGLSLAGIFASTLAKNFLQAMGFAVATIIGCCLFTYVVGDVGDIHGNLHSFLGLAWNPWLTIDIAVLTALVIFPSLTYRNFKYFQDRGRMWRRNVFGLASAVLFVLASSAAIYNRAWEVFEPVEPAHGPAKLSLANPPVMRTEGTDDNLLVRLPDGRVWFDYLSYRGSGDREKPWQAWLRRADPPLPSSAGPQRFLSGANWVSATAGHVDVRMGTTGSQNYVEKYVDVFGYLDSVGIQSDGTLWASGKSDQNTWTAGRLTRFGDETNWEQVARFRRITSVTSVLLLKRDGTLWRWGTANFDWRNWPQKWPGLRAFQPHQIGTNSDWSEIFSADGGLARKTDGSVWSVMQNESNGMQGFIRETNYDQIVTQKFFQFPYEDLGTYIRKDGTLWLFANLYTNVPGVGSQPEFETLQRSQDTNWVCSAVTWDSLVALKSDGTLWKWVSQNPYDVFSAHSVASPTRLGIHNDWVAITGVDGGVVSLAADGSLWFWPEQYGYGFNYGQILLKPSKQPEFLGNLFGKSN
jgi:ABC-type transport system involved in multi-copper enzyme maturation permease subunit